MTVDEYEGTEANIENGISQEQIREDSGVKPPEQPITKTELLALKEELLKAIQSQTGKAENRIKKEVDAKLGEVSQTVKDLKDAGVQLTDAEISVMKANAMREAVTASRNTEASRPSVSANPIEQKKIDDTNAKWRDLLKTYGVVPTANDPEFYEIPWNGVPPEEFLEKGEQQLVALATRMERPLPNKTLPGSPEARMPGPAGGMTGGGRLEQLTRRLNEIQGMGIQAMTSGKLNDERKAILEEMRTLGR